MIDGILVLNAGTSHAFGRRDQILERLSYLSPRKQIVGDAAKSPIAA